LKKPEDLEQDSKKATSIRGVKMYSQKVMEHFKKPHNMGKMKNPDGIGKVGNPSCGDIMFIYIKVGKNEKAKR